MHKFSLPALPRYDVVIVGASNAGLSAALVLGRARRRVLVLGGELPREATSFHSHNFAFPRGGATLQELLRSVRERLQPYDVQLCVAEVQHARRTATGSMLNLSNGAQVTATALVLATGVAEELPAVPGLASLWGRGVYQCPYCHGWESRHSRVVVYGRAEAGYQQAVLVRQWVAQLTLATDGPAHLTPDQHAHLAHLRIAVNEQPVAALDGTARCPIALRFKDGSRLPLDILFLEPVQRQRSSVAAQLGCAFTPDGVYVQVSETGLTTVPGVYAVGEMTGPFHQAILVAATGTRAATALHHELVFGSPALV